ncbi:MAG: hypothetical protein C4521_05195 [Actinobacteria bacterium]|nr:MAG: hypothetical protein C4521_05195 [Actinomycetota bacterium]
MIGRVVTPFFPTANGHIKGSDGQTYYGNEATFARTERKREMAVGTVVVFDVHPREGGKCPLAIHLRRATVIDRLRAWLHGEDLPSVQADDEHLLEYPSPRRARSER